MGVVSLVDIFPTIMEMASVTSRPKGIQGRSLIGGYDERPRLVLSESYPMFDIPSMKRIERALIAGEFKFISSTAEKYELFNLTKDPYEENNLAGSAPGITADLDKRLKEWIQPPPNKSGRSKRVDRNAIENLRSLGYMK
jgi:arylsulfatase A-like enzyme